MYFSHRFSSAEILEAHEELDQALRVLECAVVRGAVAVLVREAGSHCQFSETFTLSMTEDRLKYLINIPRRGAGGGLGHRRSLP